MRLSGCWSESVLAAGSRIPAQAFEHDQLETLGARLAGHLEASKITFGHQEGPGIRSGVSAVFLPLPTLVLESSMELALEAN